METEQHPLAFWGLIVVKFFALLFIAGACMLLVDPYYFEFPIAQAEGGLPADKAPPPPFATAITFAAEAGQPILIALGARDTSLGMVGAEVTGPDGRVMMQTSLPVNRGSGPHGADWKEFRSGSPMPGTYTLKLTQQAAGRMAVFFFQGPFIGRLLMLPALTALLLLLLQVAASRARSGSGAGTSKTPV